MIFPAFCENIRFTFSGKFVIIGKMLVECPLSPLKGEVAAGRRGEYGITPQSRLSPSQLPLCTKKLQAAGGQQSLYLSGEPSRSISVSAVTMH